jgi:hypothetical protein
MDKIPAPSDALANWMNKNPEFKHAQMLNRWSPIVGCGTAAAILSFSFAYFRQKWLLSIIPSSIAFAGGMTYGRRKLRDIRWEKHSQYFLYTTATKFFKQIESLSTQEEIAKTAHDWINKDIDNFAPAFKQFVPLDQIKQLDPKNEKHRSVLCLYMAAIKTILTDMPCDNSSMQETQRAKMRVVYLRGIIEQPVRQVPDFQELCTQALTKYYSMPAPTFKVDQTNELSTFYDIMWNNNPI